MQRTSWHMGEGEAWLIDGNVVCWCFVPYAENSFLCYWVRFSMCVPLRNDREHQHMRYEEENFKIQKNRSHNSCSDFTFSLLFSSLKKHSSSFSIKIQKKKRENSEKYMCKKSDIRWRNTCSTIAWNIYLLFCLVFRSFKRLCLEFHRHKSEGNWETENGCYWVTMHVYFIIKTISWDYLNIISSYLSEEWGKKRNQ